MKRQNAEAGAEQIIKRLRDVVPDRIQIGLEMKHEALKDVIMYFMIRQWDSFARSIKVFFT